MALACALAIILALGITALAGHLKSIGVVGGGVMVPISIVGLVLVYCSYPKNLAKAPQSKTPQELMQTHIILNVFTWGTPIVKVILSYQCNFENGDDPLLKCQQMTKEEEVIEALKVMFGGKLSHIRCGLIVEDQEGNTRVLHYAGNPNSLEPNVRFGQRTSICLKTDSKALVPAYCASEFPGLSFSVV